MATHLISHRNCLFHDTGYEHAERPDRLRMVMQYLDEETFPELQRHEASLANEELLLLAHTQEHVQNIKDRRPASGIVQLDPDTFMSPGSYEAALRAVGAAIDAVDIVMTEKDANVFCATRPPGHHAEADQVMGFCLFNNAAIAAYYARQKYGIERVAVIDFDVHHGNGTQHIFEKDQNLFYGSTHQAPPFYPGTGHAHETGVGNIVNVPLEEGSGSTAFRDAMTSHVLPALEKFNPELLIISAGFDAHHKDPLANINLVEEDYDWITKELKRIANKCCENRIVSLLEGGYDLLGLAQSAKTHVKALLDD
ncbi:histone deacetylase family protein [Sneathiella glossodoripedis]|uniref:histone deacetylase family protein n=1 Tax=Sneathiella glossodoripedis TaxID=418853 RepID=UPI000472FCDE|nr:histone deacetylase family protein [Sneathiella glossodoripedis]